MNMLTTTEHKRYFPVHSNITNTITFLIYRNYEKKTRVHDTCERGRKLKKLPTQKIGNIFSVSKHGIYIRLVRRKAVCFKVSRVLFTLMGCFNINCNCLIFFCLNESLFDSFVFHSI